jgi:hypothetical protein
MWYLNHFIPERMPQLVMHPLRVISPNFLTVNRFALNLLL